MQLLNAAEAAGNAAILSRVGCAIGSNIITRTISRAKDLDCKVLDVNSEESAISAAVGHVLQGKRALLTGLVWLKPAAHYRVPLVSTSPGFRNWSLNFMPASSQEAFDMVLAGYALAEDKKILLPVNVVLDRLGDYTFEPVELPGQKIVDNMLGPLKLDKYEKHLQYSGHDLEQDAQFTKVAENARKEIPKFSQNLKKRFKRTFELVEKFMLDDAEIAFVTYGSNSSNAKLAVQKLRESGEKVGLLRLKAITPFPEQEITEALQNVKKVAIVDRQVLTGSWSKLFYLIKPVYAGIASNFISADIVSVADFVDIGKRLKSAEGPEKVWLLN